mmetsp:Transcript_14068/g.27782  ORF Transcript_14068/g.27782 Transcript_14068/m.27782 type:complete len:213 (-) Transcript_14068:215-853(-)
MWCPTWVPFSRRAKLSQHFLALLLHTAGDERCVLRFGKDDLHVGTCLLDNFSSTLEGTSCAISGYPIVQLAACKVRQNFRTSGLRMKGRVCFILKLPRQKPAVFFCKFLRLQHHSSATQWCWCHDHLRPQHPHNFSAFDGERCSHRGNEIVATLGTNHCESNPCVSARCFNDSASWFQFTASLCILDDGKSQPILHRTQWIEKLTLNIQIDT